MNRRVPKTAPSMMPRLFFLEVPPANGGSGVDESVGVGPDTVPDDGVEVDGMPPFPGGGSPEFVEKFEGGSEVLLPPEPVSVAVPVAAARELEPEPEPVP